MDAGDRAGAVADHVPGEVGPTTKLLVKGRGKELQPAEASFREGHHQSRVEAKSMTCSYIYIYTCPTIYVYIYIYIYTYTYNV